MKKIIYWLIGEDAVLSKNWWHRLIKVVFLSLFSLIAIGSFIGLIFDPPRELLSKHNTTIKYSLDEYTRTYSGDADENTILPFFEEQGDFGILEGSEILYVSSYALEKSICIKSPEGNTDYLASVLYNNAPYNARVNISPSTLKEMLLENLKANPTKRCYFITEDKDIKGIDNLAQKIVLYHPNALYYVEALLLVIGACILWFIFFALIYYKLIMYIIFGNKNR